MSTRKHKTPRSIRWTLTRAMLFVAAAALLLSAGAFLTYEIIGFRAELRDQVRTLAHVLARNSTAALVFQDERDAADVLSALQEEPHVIAAALYTAQGNIFAQYPANAALGAIPRLPAEPRSSFEGGQLVVFDRVMEGERQVGTIYLQVSLAALNQRLRLYLITLSIILVASLGLAWFLSTKFQRRVSQPILALASVARAVSERRDYSVRAAKLTEDELGVLTDAFNQMLERIQTGSLALERTAERLRLALEASMTGTWDWDLATGKLTWDDYNSRLFGIKPADFGGTYEHFEQFVHPEDREPVKKAVQLALRTRRDFFSEFRAITPDGKEHLLVSRGRALYDESGTPTRMTGVTVDVTEVRQAEEARRLFANIVESSDDAIIGKDLQQHILTWNPGAEKMFGYTAEEVLGRTIEFLIPEEYRAQEQEAFTMVSRGKAVHMETVRVRKDGGRLQISLSVSPIRNAQGRIIGGSFISRDITRQKEAEAELLRLKEDLEHRVRERTAELEAANKEMEAFSYSVAHDLRGPLRHIDAYAQVLKTDFASTMNPEVEKYLDRISGSSRNLGRLVDDLLNLARVGRQDVVRQTTSLNQVVKEVTDELKEDTGSRIIEWRVGNLPDVEADPSLVKYVYANLIDNAVKYTRKRERALIEIGSAQQEGETVFFVRDNGVGFSMKYAHKLFGVFQRLHRPEDFEGTGIGLATAARIIQKHGGRVWAEAELNKGATFYFTLSRKKTK